MIGNDTCNGPNNVELLKRGPCWGFSPTLGKWVIVSQNAYGIEFINDKGNLEKRPFNSTWVFHPCLPPQPPDGTVSK